MPVSKRDWQADWKELNTYLDAEDLDPDFPYFAANALPYWMDKAKKLETKVKELETENRRLRAALDAAGISVNDAMVIGKHWLEMSNGEGYSNG